MRSQCWDKPDRPMMLYSLDVELSGYCTAHCVFCPRDKMTREKATMSREVFECLIRELADIRQEGPMSIFYSGFGEPLLNTNLFEYTKLLKKQFPGTVVRLVSNGSLLNKELCDNLLSSDISSLSCSVQDIEKNSYEAAMRGPDFDNVVKWLTYIAQNTTETGIQVFVTYVRTDQLDREIEEMMAFWHSRYINVSELKLHNRGGFLFDGAERQHARKRCSLFNTRTFIAANGEVLACCHDLDGQSRLGTIGQDSLVSILDRKIEMAHENRLFPMCNNCTEYGAAE